VVRLGSGRETINTLTVHDFVPDQKEKTSSKESVGKFRFGQITEPVIQHDFQRFERTVPIRHFCAQFGFVVQPENRS
jgi:hypothetical protein